MNVRALPRSALHTYLTLARLPVTVAANVARQGGNEQWPPTLLFESLEAAIETRVGTLLRDDVLVEIGQVRQAKVDQLRKASRLEAVAATERAEAQDDFRERREQVEDERRAADRRAQQREAQAEREAQEKEAAAAQKAAKKETAARKAKAAQEQAIDRRERAETTAALAQEAEALRTREEAIRATERVDQLEDAIDANKSARKTG